MWAWSRDAPAKHKSIGGKWTPLPPSLPLGRLWKTAARVVSPRAGPQALAVAVQLMGKEGGTEPPMHTDAGAVTDGGMAARGKELDWKIGTK